MGRSSKQEAALNRTRIVETASDLFRARGVDQVSVADIMSMLGMTTGGFYKHFASKEALVAEALEKTFEQSNAAWRTVGVDDPPKQGRRAQLVSHYLRRDPDRRCPMIAYAPHTASATSPGAARETYAEGVMALLDQFLESSPVSDSNSPAATSERDALVLFAAMIGARVLSEAGGEAPLIDRLRQAVLEAAAEDR